jgi:ABC-type antimicrobial peptide transport system permease subunit
LRKKLLLLVLLFITKLSGNQNPYILTHDGLIDQRAQLKIMEIGNETKSKLNVNLYVDIKENNGINPKEDRKIRMILMKKKELSLVAGLIKPYAILTISVDQLYANILMSENLKDIIDKDDILDNYVIPLLASKDKNRLFAKTSASILNGYAQMADSIADSQNIKLDSSIGSEGKTASSIWKVFMYTLVVIGLLSYIVIIMREKKYKKGIDSGK